MIIFLYQDGTATISATDRVFQGSTVNKVTVLSNFPSSTPMAIGFTLPDGTVAKIGTGSNLATGYAPMTLVYQSEYDVNEWVYVLPLAITEQSGTVTLNIKATTTDGTQMSYTLTFLVETALLPELPTEPTQDIYDLIVQYLAQDQSQILGLTQRTTTLEQRATDLDETLQTTLTDITAESFGGGFTRFTKRWMNGQTADFSVPSGIKQTTVDGVVQLDFTEESWLRNPEGNYYIAFGQRETLQTSNRFLCELVAIDDDNGDDKALADTVYKTTDGTAYILTDVPYNGRLFIFNGLMPIGGGTSGGSVPYVKIVDNWESKTYGYEVAIAQTEHKKGSYPSVEVKEIETNTIYGVKVTIDEVGNITLVSTKDVPSQIIIK